MKEILVYSVFTKILQLYIRELNTEEKKEMKFSLKEGCMQDFLPGGKYRVESLIATILNNLRAAEDFWSFYQ